MKKGILFLALAATLALGGCVKKYCIMCTDAAGNNLHEKCYRTQKQMVENGCM